MLETYLEKSIFRQVYICEQLHEKDHSDSRNSRSIERLPTHCLSLTTWNALPTYSISKLFQWRNLEVALQSHSTLRFRGWHSLNSSISALTFQCTRTLFIRGTQLE